MFYIRTEKNKYNIDVIIDVCDSIQFVNSTNFQWIEVGDEQKPENGNYYYNGKIISIDSPDYSIIEDIIFEYEEPLRVERDENLPVFIEEENENNINSENVSDANILSAIDFQFIKSDSPLPLEITEEQNLEILELDPPKLIIYDDIESNQENLDLYEFNLANIEITISAYESGNFTISDNMIIFNSPIEYSNGVIEDRVIIPSSMTLEDQILHLKNQRDQMILLIDRIKTDLQITD